MEILIQVFLVIIIVYLIGLFIYLIIRYYKILTYLNPSKSPKNGAEIQKEIQKDTQENIEENHSFIPFEQSNEQDDIQGIDINRNYVMIPLANQDYSRMIISNQKIKYEIVNNLSGKINKASVYEFQYDQNFNQKFCHYEYTKDEMIVYKGREETQLYKGNIDEKQIIYFLGYDSPQIQEQYFYNTFITKQYLEVGHMNILNAFVEYINTQEKRYFLIKNENHQQTQKMKLFIPISVMSENNPQQNFQNYLFQYKPIQFQLEVFCEKIFFVSSRYDNPLHPILFEINFYYKNICIVHDLKQTFNDEKIKTQYLKIINKIYQDVNQVIFCIDCNARNQSKVEIYDVCQQLQNYSSEGQIINIREFIQKEIFRI